ncbi:amino acid ABC transporter substrate-binding protein [Desulfopila sp. IMCC35008]|uniref:amino acid ABC transporter substrate-binding protein n=1 Tax=Desulfopila sp. IMCC35008 TaxID=2653858 RepID=UPI0013D18571|nr:amino acid ABC transporter substrate-binding protein [Desulfopila sp. IMCC35008]
MKKISWFVAAVALFCISGVAFGATRDEVQKRGYLQCGVSTGLPGFSSPDNKGNWTGLDTDICRAVAAAVLGDAKKVKFIPLTAMERFTPLLAGEVDMLSRNTSWTFTRDSSLGLNFAGVSYYDGQGFMVLRKRGITNITDLAGATICVQSGTTKEHDLADYFRQNKMEYRPLLFDTPDQAIKGFETGRCDAITSGRSQLYGLAAKLAVPTEADVLPEVIANEPLGPVVRQGDDAWFNIVKWSLFAMINGEELGVSSANIESMRGTDSEAIKRLLGVVGIKGQGLGLADDWAYRIIKQVGNYGEVFERNLGEDSPLKIDRGLNRLWSKGGIVYAPPIR